MFNHRDVKITVAGNGYFEAEVKEVKVREKTLDLAKEAIDKALASYAKSKTLNLKVVGILSDTVAYYEHREKDSDKLHKAVLIGLNRTTGDLLFTGVPKDRAFRTIFPDTPGCEKKVQEYLELSHQMSKLRKHIEAFEIKGKSGRQDAAKYDETLEAMELQYAKAKHEHQ